MTSFKKCLYFGAFVGMWILFIVIQFDVPSVISYLNLDLFTSINKQPIEPYPSNEFLNETDWHCLPNERFISSSWYSGYEKNVAAVLQLPSNNTYPANYACSRWWHASPQVSYSDRPVRAWSGLLRPEHQAVAPCEFGQEMRPEMKCAESLRKLFLALDSLRVVYFPRSGTELGITRDSAYLSADGDIDLYVDMPQSLLFEKLSKLLDTAPHMDGTGYTAEVHYHARRGCPEVHMVYNDWISNELQHLAGPQDVCSCWMNSVQLLCHRDAARRMYVQYGPSWRVPLGVKLLDMPYWATANRYSAWTWELSAKLSNLVDKRTGLIEEAAIRELTRGNGSEEDMPLVLAQLNIIADSLGLI